MRTFARWLMVMTIPTLLAACGQDDRRDFESPQTTSGAAGVPPATLPEAAPAPGTRETPTIDPPAPPVSPYDQEDLAQLPPLSDIADGNQRLLETARRAMIQARTELAGRNYTMVTEHVDVAMDALRQARRNAPQGTEQARAIDQALAFLDTEMPGTPARATELIQAIATARGPIPGGPVAQAEPAPVPPQQAPAEQPQTGEMQNL